ncbi:hypothetical protein NDU88_002125 [Pleurodeles waltl]|uniref:Uncharacterized protein n=1 Tax=Pleurodeles waltl TaxID=8319 RepID=A0AAV7Q540_PLEWA|nr:hypothetical protein NDU88_002125 [Pleurodeles waltl]
MLRKRISRANPASLYPLLELGAAALLGPRVPVGQPLSPALGWRWSYQAWIAGWLQVHTQCREGMTSPESQNVGLYSNVFCIMDQRHLTDLAWKRLLTDRKGFTGVSSRLQQVLSFICRGLTFRDVTRRTRKQCTVPAGRLPAVHWQSWQY